MFPKRRFKTSCTKHCFKGRVLALPVWRQNQPASVLGLPPCLCASAPQLDLVFRDESIYRKKTKQQQNQIGSKAERSYKALSFLLTHTTLSVHKPLFLKFLCNAPLYLGCESGSASSQKPQTQVTCRLRVAGHNDTHLSYPSRCHQLGCRAGLVPQHPEGPQQKL